MGAGGGADPSTAAPQNLKSTQRARTHVQEATRQADHAPADGPDANAGAGPRIEFRHKARFIWKNALLLITFVALIPILLYQDVLGAQVYLWFLVGVHALGLFIFAWGVGRHDIAPSMKGFLGRLAGLATVTLLLWIASKGLNTEFGSLLFWGSLFALWAIHSAGLLLLHLRGRKETSCPFVPE